MAILLQQQRLYRRLRGLDVHARQHLVNQPIELAALIP
jgi:hypothetical protein